jgi:cell division protein FtsL
VLEAPTAGWARRLAAVGAVVFAALVLAVAIQGERIRTQERYDAVRAELLRSDERNRDLRVAVAQAESPEVVLDAARDLGMVEPGPIVAVPAAPVGDPVDTDVP